MVKQKPGPATNVTKNDIFLVSGNDEMVQHIRPINKSVLKEILDIY